MFHSIQILVTHNIRVTTYLFQDIYHGIIKSITKLPFKGALVKCFLKSYTVWSMLAINSMEHERMLILYILSRDCPSDSDVNVSDCGTAVST